MQTSLNGRAAIILAGGECKRLKEHTRTAGGSNVSKQYFAVVGDIPMLEQTRRRLSLSIPTGYTFFTLNRLHERFFSPFLADVDPGKLVIQPANRGTAPAILYSLLRVAEVAPHSSVVLMPSDHYIKNERTLTKCVECAFDAAELYPDLIFLLGAQPDEPDSGYGWIEPGVAFRSSPIDILEVRRLLERPTYEVAIRLMRTGCLRNTFIMVARLSTLLSLYVSTMPELYFSFTGVRSSFGSAKEAGAIGRIYARMRSCDFSRDVLQRSALNLRVVRMPDAGWSDIGEPRRVAKAFGMVEPKARCTAAAPWNLRQRRPLGRGQGFPNSHRPHY